MKTSEWFMELWKRGPQIGKLKDHLDKAGSVLALLEAAENPDLMMEYCPDNSEELMALLRAALCCRPTHAAN